MYYYFFTVFWFILNSYVQKSSFDLYRSYGANNEHAQTLLYELEEDESIKAFFTVSMRDNIMFWNLC